MKKIYGIAVAMMLGLSMIGCEETTIEDTATIEEPKQKQEETIQVEEKKEEVVKEEKVEEPEEKVEKFDQEKLNHYLTTSLTGEEYEAYFNEIKFDETGYSREIEFDGYIVDVIPSEKYSTRSELALAGGDYDGIDVNNYPGVTILTRDIGNYKIAGLTPGTNVKIKARIEKYDVDGGYLKISIIEIEAR